MRLSGGEKMSQDIVADVLNQIMNAKTAGKSTFKIDGRTSKLLVEVLRIMKQNEYISYKQKSNSIEIELKDLNKCRAIKPRSTFGKKNLNKYERRFLPARDFGILIVSTNKGLMTNKEAEEENIGGCLIAYVF